MPLKPTFAQLKEMVRLRHGKAVGSKRSIIDPIIEHWDEHIAPTHIASNPRNMCHFLSQMATETAHFKTLTEYASGEAYNGREDLGNTRPGDGPRYRGRGYLQLTGRAGYRRIGQAIGVDLEGNPGLAAHPETAIRAAVAIWIWKGLMGPKADGDHPADVKIVTRAINGGLNGYEDRLAYYRAARVLWPNGAGQQPASTPDKQERMEALVARINKDIAELEKLSGTNWRLTQHVND